MGQYLRSSLEQLGKGHKTVGRISGMGLLLALFLVADNETNTPLDSGLHIGSFIREYCYQHGMILRNNGDILVFAPALIITEKEVDQIIQILDAALQAATKHYGL